MSGFKVERLNDPNTEVRYSDAESEFRFERDSQVRRTSQSAAEIGDFTWDDVGGDLVLTGPGGNEYVRQSQGSPIEFPEGIAVDFPLKMPDDSLNSFVDATATTASALGDEIGYTLDVDSEPVVEVSGESDGVGGIKNERLRVLTRSGAPTFTIDKYNASLGQYEPQFEVRDDGRLELYDPGQGVVLRSQNGTRHEIYVEDDGTIVSEQL